MIKKLGYCSTVSAINFFFAHSGQMMSSASVINPLPTKDPRQEEHTKQSLCQCRPSKEMNRVPPIPTIQFMPKKRKQCSSCQIRAEQGELTGDGFGTSCTTFGKEFTETFCAVGFVISGSKALASQGFLAVSASETLTMPGIVAIGNSTLSNHL